MNDEPLPRATLILPPKDEDWDLAVEELAHLPVILRSAHAVQKAGVERFYLLSSRDNKDSLLHLFRNQAKIHGQFEWLDENDPAQLKEFCRRQSTFLFVFNGNLLFDWKIAKEMVEALQPEEKKELLTLEFPADRKPNSQARLLLVSPTLLPTILSALKQNSDWSRLDKATAGLREKKVHIWNDWLHQEIRRENIQQTADTLLRHLGKPTDNFVIRQVRKISARIAKSLSSTSIKPNHVTVFSFILGLMAAFSMYQASYGWVVFGAALFVIAWIFDCADGMLARLKLEESRLGAWLDLVLDNIVHVAVFVAITKTVHTQAHSKDLVLYGGGLLLFGAVLSFAMVAYHLTHEKKESKERDKRAETIEKLLEHMIHRDFCLWILLLAVLNQLEIFFWAAVVGINLFAGLFLYLNIKKGFFRVTKRFVWRQGEFLRKSLNQGR